MTPTIAQPITRQIVVLALAANAVACTSGAPRPPAPQSYALGSPASTVFPTAIAVLGDWNLPITFSDRDTGLISTDEMSFLGRQQLLDESAGHWANCGSELFFSRAGTADEFLVRISVAVRAISADSTEVRMQTIMTVRDRSAVGSEVARCATRGRLEEQFVAEMRDRLGLQDF